MVELGDLCEDKVSGFKGIAVATTSFLNGCTRITLQPQGLDKDGKVFGDAWFDVQQINILKKAKVDVKPKKTGGPVTSRNHLKD